MADSPDRVTIDLAVGRLTGLLRRYLPDLLSGLYLVGSAADGDFRSGHSDLDFVAVLSRPASNEDLEALVLLHRTYASDPTLPPLDGIWVTEADLAAGPDRCAEGPTTRENQFLATAAGNRNPLTWLALRQHALPLFGGLDVAKLWHDPARLASWTWEHVEAHWVPWHARSSILLSRRGLALLGFEAPMRGVLGISLLHHILATGTITSRSGAGDYALTAFDARWHRIASECLRTRRGQGKPLYANPFARRRDALDFVAMVIGAIRTGYFTPG